MNSSKLSTVLSCKKTTQNNLSVTRLLSGNLEPRCNSPGLPTMVDKLPLQYFSSCCSTEWSKNDQWTTQRS